MISFANRQPLFPLGQIVATPAALEVLEEAGQTPSEFLARHVRGDWGEELCDEDKELNDEAIKDGSRILSAYTLKSGAKLWVITEADRSSTCALLPSDY